MATYRVQNIGADNDTDGAVLLTRVSDGQQVLVQNSYINTVLLDNADGTSDNSIDFDAIFQIGLDNTNPSINEVASAEEYTFENIGADSDIDGAVIMTRVSDGQQVLVQNDYINTVLLDDADGTSDNSVDFDAIFQIGLDNTNASINEVTSTEEYTYQDIGAD